MLTFPNTSNAHLPIEGIYLYGGGASRSFRAGNKSFDTCFAELGLFRPYHQLLPGDISLTFAEDPLYVVAREHSSLNSFMGPTKLSPNT